MLGLFWGNSVVVRMQQCPLFLYFYIFWRSKPLLMMRWFFDCFTLKGKIYSYVSSPKEYIPLWETLIYNNMGHEWSIFTGTSLSMTLKRRGWNVMKIICWVACFTIWSLLWSWCLSIRMKLKGKWEGFWASAILGFHAVMT